MASEGRLTDVVIGSGPAGLAAALGIIERGGIPTIVDFGGSPTFSSATIDRKASLAMKGDPSRDQIFEYPKSFVTSADGKHLPISSARGGLSSIWGAGILALSLTEMPELSEIYESLADGYQALFNRLPYAGGLDQTSERFPWPTVTEPAPQSLRYKKIVEAAQKNRSDVLIGYPRLSVNSSNGRCIRCGQCLSGCPEELFLSARREFSRLNLLGLCRLLDGPVIRLLPSRSGVKILMPDSDIMAERVYLAAGPVGTPALLQRSQLAPPTLEVQDSAVFYTGFLNLNPYSGDETSYTSSHAVAYSRSAGSSDFQLAFYECNEEYQERLKSLAPRLGKFLKIPGPLFKRVNAGIGFLDSSVSGRLILNFRGDRTWVNREKSRNLKSHARQAIFRTAKVVRPLGIIALPVALVPPPGSGYHSGASLPLGGEHVDMAGRLRSEPAVNVVDASSLPKIWAGSHTFTAMANAYRIAVAGQ